MLQDNICQHIQVQRKNVKQPKTSKEDIKQDVEAQYPTEDTPDEVIFIQSD